MTELKLCPFCGSLAVIDSAHYTHNSPYNVGYYVKCPNCGLKSQQVKTADTTTAIQAIDKVVSLWNERVDDDNYNNIGSIETTVTTPKDRISVTVRRLRHD